MLISVILPVYNVSDYIEACLDSLLHQSIGQEKIEVILIDDCSTDDSVAKMRNYEQQFSHFKLYQCPVNYGAPGKPRNIGVAQATGDFLHFMDPDDILASDAYEQLLASMGDQDDFAMGKMVSFNEDGSTFQHVTFKEYKLDKTYEHVKLDDVPFFSQVKVGVVLKLIRKSFYDAHHISFVEGLRNGEDKLVDTLLYTQAQSFSYTPQIIYYYRNRDTGDNKSITHQDVMRSIENDIAAYHICKPFYNKEQLQFFKINALRSIFWKVLDQEFYLIDNSQKLKIFTELFDIVNHYEPRIFNLYLRHELPIIHLIQQREYELAISYAALLEARRRYFYSATALQAKAAEIKRFKSSKSYKLHRLVTTIKRTIGLKQR